MITSPAREDLQGRGRVSEVSDLIPVFYFDCLTCGVFPVRAIYPYQSQGPDELGLQEGEILELSAGGQDYGNGWWEGKDEKSEPNDDA